jgi:hypothetical protein
MARTLWALNLCILAGFVTRLRKGAEQEGQKEEAESHSIFFRHSHHCDTGLSQLKSPKLSDHFEPIRHTMHPQAPMDS